jgi:hypothetical protein
MFYKDFWVTNSSVMAVERLAGILKTFSREEIKAFEKFILSPYFNSNKNYVRFYRELVRFYPEFRSDLLSFGYIFKRLFPGKEYSGHTMWNLSSGLEKLAEEFLVQSSLKDHEFEKLKLIITKLGLKRLDKLYLKKLGEMEKLLGDSLVEDTYFLKLAEYVESKSSFFQKVKGQENITAKYNIEKAEIYTLDYLVNICRVIGNIISYSRTSDKKWKYDITEDLVKIFDLKGITETSKKNNYKYASLIEFYCNMILFMTNQDDEKSYLNARTFLFKNHKLFEKYEKRNLSVNLINFCLQKYMLGNPNYARELFLLFRFRLENDLAAYENGRISKAFYNLAIFSAASVKKIQWARKVIDKYTPQLFEEYQEEMRNLAEAYIYFNTGKYSEVLDSLKKFKYTDVIDKVHVKNLIAKTYYEMKEYEPLLYHIDSTKHFFRKNDSIGDYIKVVNSNFINYLYYIVKASEKPVAGKLVKLKEKLEKDKKVNYKIWLMEKIEELKVARN